MLDAFIHFGKVARDCGVQHIRAVANAVNLKGKSSFLIDFGGGSEEVTISQGRNILSTEIYKIATVRLL